MSNVSGTSGPGGAAPKKDIQTTDGPKGAANESDVQKMKDSMQPAEKKKQAGEGKVFKEGGAIDKALEKGADPKALSGKATAKDAVVSEAIAQAQAGAQAASQGVNPSALASNAPVQGAGNVAQASSTQEMASLANEMTSQILASDAKSNLGKGSEIRMTLSDANPNLKGTEVILNRGDDGNLNIRFNTNNVEAQNYIAQNRDGLKNALNDAGESNVNFLDNSAEGDDAGSNRESQGEYIPEESEEA